MIILCIAGFVVAGFEHCVANMATFVTAALLVPGGISLTAALKSGGSRYILTLSLIIVTRILGSVIFIAMVKVTRIYDNEKFSVP